MGEDDDRADAGRGREQRVLERSEAHHADARLPFRQAAPSQRHHVGREPAVGDEHAEAGEDDGGNLHHPEVGALLDARDLAVGDHVAEQGDQLTCESERDPQRLRVNEPVQDVLEPRNPGQRDHRPERDRCADRDERRQLQRRMVEVPFRPEPLERRLERR